MEVRGQVMWVFLMCYIFGHIITSHNYGFLEALSKFEDLEIEKKLKTMNKPAVKIIKTIDGERYGCVDFFKQPGFDHPSMKNHTYHYKMRPTGIPEEMREKKTNISENEFGHLWENGVGCPIGTVPIRRVTKEDILGLNSLDENYEPRGSWNTTSYDPNNVIHYDQHHYAVGRTKNIGMSYTGATTRITVTAPIVKPNQYSASRLHFQMGDDFIQVGITVNPILYKDHKPRIFAYTKAGGKSCYNSHCNVGMISVRQDFPLGLELKKVSVYNNFTYYLYFSLLKDKANGNWYLLLGEKQIVVGFWPSHRFRKSFGNFVEWGGEVYSAWQPSPQMGFGRFPLGYFEYDPFCKQISILDANYHIDYQVNHLEVFSDDTRGYRVIAKMDRYEEIGHVIYYGGPGNI